MTLYLSRLRLRRDPDANALKALIDPDNRAQALDAHHRLIWSLFADTPDRRRDFLWRADGRGRFYTLSHRPPTTAPLFEPPEVKEFAPDLSEGDRLSFVLRTNATKALPNQGGKRGKRADVVMALLHDITGQSALPDGEHSDRPARRMALAGEAAQAWMAQQGARSGFRTEVLAVQDYSVMPLPGRRGARKHQPQFGILDLSGTLALTDATAFMVALGQGFGRAKAFGCGLMLLRRAP